MQKRNRIYVAFFDGCCEPINPGGNMGMGGLIMDDNGEVIKEFSSMIEAKPGNTNNVAEYLSLICILEHMRNMEDCSFISIRGDSNMVIQQIKGAWKIKSGAYSEYAHVATAMIRDIKLQGVEMDFLWIPRGDNSAADKLSKKHLEAKGVEFVIQPDQDTINGESKMPFGRYADKPMKDIPRPYLAYIFTNGMIPGKYTNVKQYIKDNVEFCPTKKA